MPRTNSHPHFKTKDPSHGPTALTTSTRIHPVSHPIPPPAPPERSHRPLPWQLPPPSPAKKLPPNAPLPAPVARSHRTHPWTLPPDAPTARSRSHSTRRSRGHFRSPLPPPIPTEAPPPALTAHSRGHSHQTLPPPAPAATPPDAPAATSAARSHRPSPPKLHRPPRTRRFSSQSRVVATPCCCPARAAARTVSRSVFLARHAGLRSGGMGTESDDIGPCEST